MTKFYDVIVVGAGPAGSTAAYKLAKAGLKVVLLERGKYPGSKNMFGGLLHNTPVINEIFPSFWEILPMERYVFKKTLSFMTETSSFSIVFETSHFENLPYNGATVFRPVFDNWLANQAVREGVLLLCNCMAENLIWNNNKVTGVTIKGRAGELKGNIVIAADGVLSFLAKSAGLRKNIQTKDMGLGVKLLLSLPKETIDERFNLVRDEGADISIIGLMDGIGGGCFIYTNRESISIGIVCHLDSLKAKADKPYEVLAKILSHPHIRKLIKGSIPVEYSAHLIPEGGIKAVPDLYTNGMMVVGDAAGLCYTNGINLEGINLAMTSGAIAAEVAIEAAKNNNYSAEQLSLYENKLKDTFVIKDMNKFKHAVDMMHMERLFNTYPEVICEFMEKLYKNSGVPREKITKLGVREILKRVKATDAISDLIKIGRALL